MKPFEIRAKLKEMGFKEDNYGNMLVPSGTYRIHFNSISLRVERKVQIKSSRLDRAQNIVDSVKTIWRNCKTVYYKDVGVTNGQFHIGTAVPDSYAATAVAA